MSSELIKSASSCKRDGSLYKITNDRLVREANDDKENVSIHTPGNLNTEITCYAQAGPYVLMTSKSVNNLGQTTLRLNKMRFPKPDFNLVEINHGDIKVKDKKENVKYAGANGIKLVGSSSSNKGLKTTKKTTTDNKVIKSTKKGK